MVTIPFWVLLLAVSTYLVLNSAANALSLTDRDPYRFFVRFLRNLTQNAAPFMEHELQSLHLQAPPLPPITDPDATPNPTQADVSQTDPSAAAK